jgi:hypothetical protein
MVPGYGPYLEISLPSLTAGSLPRPGRKRDGWTVAQTWGMIRNLFKR